MKFDSSMNSQFVKRIDFGSDSYCNSAIQLNDSSYIFIINTPTDLTYLVKLNSTGTLAKALRIITPINATLISEGSNVLLSYSTINFINGVLKLDQDLIFINNYSIIDSTLHTFFTDANITGNKYNALCSNGRDCWFLELDSMVSASCDYKTSTLIIDTVRLSLTEDSISNDTYSGGGPETPYGIYFTNAFLQWEDSCFTMINKINERSFENRINLFPNPTLNHLYIIQNNIKRNNSINVFNSFGQKQELEYNCIENKEYIEINTSTLLPGLFFIVIIMDNQRVIKRFIKMNEF